MYRIFILLLSVFVFISCSEAGHFENAPSVESTSGFDVTEGGGYTVSSADFTAVKNADLSQDPLRSAPLRKLIRNGSMHCQVGSLDSARTQLLALLEGYRGYVSSENVSSNYSSELTYTMRVPEDTFDNFILAVEAISSKVLSRNINVRDVTDQYVDIAARLSTKRALHKRYTQLLSKAKNVEEVINVERELSKVLADIEASEARLKSLGDQASYATLTLSLSTASEPIAQASFFSDLGDSFSAGWSGVKMAVLIGTALWPLLLVAGILFFGVRWGINRRKQNQAAA